MPKKHTQHKTIAASKSLRIDQQDLIIWSASVIYGCKRCFSDFFPFFLINTIAHPIIEKTKEETMRVFYIASFARPHFSPSPWWKKNTVQITTRIWWLSSVPSYPDFPFSLEKNTPKHCDKNLISRKRFRIDV